MVKAHRTSLVTSFKRRSVPGILLQGLKHLWVAYHWRKSMAVIRPLDNIVITHGLVVLHSLTIIEDKVCHTSIEEEVCHLCHAMISGNSNSVSRAKCLGALKEGAARRSGWRAYRLPFTHPGREPEKSGRRTRRRQASGPLNTDLHSPLC